MKHLCTPSSFIQTNLFTLTSLDIAISPTPPGLLSPAVLSQLTHLGLSDAWLTMEDMQTIFTHGTNLQSLILQGKPVRSFAPAVVFKSHQRSSGTLPSLTDLTIRINDRYSIDLGLVLAMGRFLRDRAGLRRLALHDLVFSQRILEGLTNAGVWETLSGLRVLALGLNGLVGVEPVNAMVERLPEGLKVVVLRIVSNVPVELVRPPPSLLLQFSC